MYSSLESVKKKIDWITLLQLLNDEVRLEEDIDLTNLNDPVIIRFMDGAIAAQNEMDPYLRVKYTIPFQTVPERVIDLSDRLTIINLYRRRGELSDKQDSDYKSIVNSLKDISMGKSDLGIASEPQKISNEIKTNKTASDRIFSKDMWNKF